MLHWFQKKLEHVYLHNLREATGCVKLNGLTKICPSDSSTVYPKDITTTPTWLASEPPAFRCLSLINHRSFKSFGISYSFITPAPKSLGTEGIPQMNLKNPNPVANLQLNIVTLNLVDRFDKCKTNRTVKHLRPRWNSTRWKFMACVNEWAQTREGPRIVDQS